MKPIKTKRAKLDLSQVAPSQDLALAIIKKKKIDSTGALGKEMGFSHQRASQILEKLEKKGLIKYIPAQWIILQ